MIYFDVKKILFNPEKLNFVESMTWLKVLDRSTMILYFKETIDLEHVLRQAMW